jgi:hypothetical protein
MPRSLYAFTPDTPEHSTLYTCSTYRPSLSHKYGICQSLSEPDTLDLASVSLGPVSVGNMISGFFLLACVLGMLGLLKWAVDERMRRRRWAWGLELGEAGRRSRREGARSGGDGWWAWGKGGWRRWRGGRREEAM